MRNYWYISDSHFNHSRILSFTDKDGNLMRPGFSSVQEMDETIINNWNKVVRDGDYVYHLGDFGMGPGFEIEDYIPRLNGSKTLIVGNHDNIKKVAPHFRKVELWKLFKEHGFTCSHIPLREDQMFKVKLNLHGHIHEQEDPSIRHMNISVERTGYRPIHLDEIIAEIKKRGL